MSRRSVLLLGGSAQQVVAIERARELGYRTVLCDWLPDNPGRLVADAWHPVSTTDLGAVLGVARAEGVSGVLAYASDPAAPTAAGVAEALGLPGNPVPAVEVLSEKHRFRTFLEGRGFRCPRRVELAAGCGEGEALAAVGAAGLSWPLVVKPTDSSGSKGVAVVDGPGGMAGALAAASARSRNGVLIAEEYIRRSFPRVVGGDVFVVGGRVEFWGLMSCLRDPARPLVPAGERLPSGLSRAQEAACRAEVQRLVSELGVRDGELNVELLVGEGGSVWFLELGARAGGNMLPVQLSDASGVDLVAANVLAAMGEDPGPVSWGGPPEGGAAFATYVLHAPSAGRLAGVSYSEGLAPHVYRTAMYKGPGDSVGPLDGADKAIGIAFMRFEGEAQMEGFLGDIASHVRVGVEP